MIIHVSTLDTFDTTFIGAGKRVFRTTIIMTFLAGSYSHIGVLISTADSHISACEFPCPYVSLSHMSRIEQKRNLFAAYNMSKQLSHSHIHSQIQDVVLEPPVSPPTHTPPRGEYSEYRARLPREFSLYSEYAPRDLVGSADMSSSAS